MPYNIVRIKDEITVFKEQQKVLFVQRQTNWLGVQKSNFFVDDKLVLITTSSVFLFSLYLKIKYQNLDEKIDLQINSGNYYLQCDNARLRFKRIFFRNPQCIFFKNDIQVGEMHGKLTIIGNVPISMDVIFYQEQKENFYLLLLYLMKVPQSLIL
jgi:hypothetical protein